MIPPESPLHLESLFYYPGARQHLFSCTLPPPPDPRRHHLGQKDPSFITLAEILKIPKLTNFRALFSHLGGTHKAFANINGISFGIFKDQRIQENMQAGRGL